MEQHIDLPDPKTIASQIDAEIRALPLMNVPNLRTVRRKYSRLLKKAAPEFVLEVARELFYILKQALFISLSPYLATS